MKHKINIYIAICIITALSGCSHVVHERKAGEYNSEDRGTETRFEIRGPRAVLKHSF